VKVSLKSEKVSFKSLKRALVDKIREMDPKMRISTDPEMQFSFRPDIVLSHDEMEVLIELKSSTYPQNIIHAIYQVVGYDRLVPERFNTIFLVVPEASLKSKKLQMLIDKVHQDMPKFQVLTYQVMEDKLVFSKTNDKGPFPRTFSSNLPSTFTIPRRKRVTLSFPKSMRVIRYLLTHSRTTQSEIANKVDVSIGLVNKIVSYLVEHEIAGYKRRHLILLEPWKLLNEVSWSRSMERLKILDLFVPNHYPKVEQLEEKIIQTLQKTGARYAFTLFSAAKRYTAYSKKYDVVQLYVDAFDEENLELLRELKPRENGKYHLEIFEPDSSDILRESTMLSGFRLCSEIQTVIDLSSYGTIGKELAIELYSKIRQREG